MIPFGSDVTVCRRLFPASCLKRSGHEKVHYWRLAIAVSQSTTAVVEWLQASVVRPWQIWRETIFSRCFVKNGSGMIPDVSGCFLHVSGTSPHDKISQNENWKNRYGTNCASTWCLESCMVRFSPKCTGKCVGAARHPCKFDLSVAGWLWRAKNPWKNRVAINMSTETSKSYLTWGA